MNPFRRMRLTNIPAIWMADTTSLQKLDVLTCKDLLEEVNAEGIPALSSRSEIPEDTLYRLWQRDYWMDDTDEL